MLIKGDLLKSETPEVMVHQDLNIIKFTSNEATLLISNLNLDGLDCLVMVTTDVAENIWN